MKNKLILIVMLIICSILVLTGCKGEEVTVSASYVNSPTQLVYEVADDNFDGFVFDKNKAAGLSVYWYMSDKSITGPYNVSNIRGEFEREKLDYIDDANHKKGAVATYSFTVFKEEGSDAALRYQSTVDIYLKGSGASDTDESVVMLSVNILDISILTHILGETFKGTDYIQEDDKISARNILANGDITEETDKLEFVDVDPRVTDQSRYWGGTYDIYFTVGNNAVLVPIVVNGGEQPINDQKNPGWFDIVIVQPFGWLMSFVSFGGFFAVGILLTTLIVRTIAWPVYASTNNMSFKMNLAQPELQKLQKKYENRKDKESQQRMQMEMMQIYKKHKVNFFGCLMPIIQFPIFSAMWQLVRRVMAPGGMFNDKINNPYLFGVIDLTAGANLWTWDHIVLVVICGISMFALNFISQRQPNYLKKTNQNQPKTPQANQQQKTMKMMMYMMSVMMIFMAFSSPNAMSFYWIVGNIFSIGQNLLTKFLNKRRYEKHQEENIYGFELTSKQPEKKVKKIQRAQFTTNQSDKKKDKK